MVDRRDPIVTEKESCEYVFTNLPKSLENSRNASSDRGCRNALARSQWCLSVRSPTLHRHPITRNLTVYHSWEFLTTLDYEWSIMQGHRPYRWTIWVCNYTLTLFGSHFQRWGLRLICPFRFTPLHVWLLSWS